MSGQNLKEKFEIPVGEAIIIEEHSFEFIGVTMDSRCPKDVNCVMAGWAQIELDITDKNSKNRIERKVPAELTEVNRPFLLGIPSKNIKVLVGALKPYPLSTDRFEDREYVLEVWVLDN